jgi:hypothetical protein
LKEEIMKKLLTIAAAVLLISGVAGFAIAETIPFCCTASGFWNACTIWYDTNNREFAGVWHGWAFGESCSGALNGDAIADLIYGVHGSGNFYGDYEGTWEGSFSYKTGYPDTCWGEYMANSDPPGAGEFWGSRCE